MIRMAQIFRCPAPLNPADRSAFLFDVAPELAGKELGDGLVLRTCREVQRKYWRAPIEGHHAGKYR
jgi:hypothetical protein